ncbi:MAG: efflux RND transporter periplasmic adaptor subunit [Oscillospiraceae bacterium]|nr:efflux RND transporter periplasmic adaptor subunit [Oscillospiraceae bacterium]
MNKKVGDKGRKKGRGAVIAVLAVVLAGGGVSAYHFVNAQNSSESTPGFREYTVSKGNISIGTNESGTVTVERKYVTYPCTAEVEEVYVKTGQTVKEGDPLLKLSASDIDEIREEYEDRIASASLALDEAKLEHKTKTEQAQNTLESTISKGDNAAAEYNSYLEKTAASRASSQKDLASLKKEKTEYEALLSTYDAEHKVLTDAEEKLSLAKEKYKQMEKQYKEYQRTDTANSDAVDAAKNEYDDYVESMTDKSDEIKTLKTAYEDAKSAYEKAKEDYDTAVDDYETALEAAQSTSSGSTSDSQSSGSSGSSGSSNSQSNVTSAQKKMTNARKALNEALDKYNTARLAYNVHYQKLEDKISDTIETYEDRISGLEKTKAEHEKITKAYKEELDEQNDAVSEAEEEYSEIKDDFTEKYGSNDRDSLVEMIDKLDDDIASAELALRTSSVSEASDDLNARQQADQAITDAGNAQAVYEQTVASLDSSLASKQKEYDKAVSEYDEFMESVESGGMVYAPCDGAVSSVGVAVGDEVRSDMSIVTLMDRRYIYLSSAVSEEDITALTVGQECSVTLSAYEGRTFDAHIDTISTEPARSSGSVSYTVTVKLDDESGLNVLEGMTGEIDFLEKQVTDVLCVNVNAVSFRDGVSYVRVYDDNGNVVEKEVTTGFTDGRNVEISGVSAGDSVLAEIVLSGTDQRG